MGLLDFLSGGTEQRAKVEDLIRNFETGQVGKDMSNEEAIGHYDSIAPHLSPVDYRAAAEEAISHLTPEQRSELVQQLQGEARKTDVNFPGLHEDPQLHLPDRLADVLANMHRQQPGILGQLVGGQTGGRSLLSNPIVKMALVGIAAAGARRMIHG